MIFMKKNKSKVIHNYDAERAQKLAELGSRLRQVRQEQNLSLEEVESLTLIQWRQLHAIEEGKLQHLPEPVYIQGFIRRFADALGLNGAAFASDFPTDTNQRLLPYSWGHLRLVQFRPVHLYGLYILLIMISVNLMSYMMNRSSFQVGLSDSYLEQEGESVSNPQSSKAQLAKLTQTGTPIASNANANAEAVRIGLILKEESWVEIVIDGKTAFEGTLPEGTQRSWEAKQQLTVIAGNAGGVLVAINDGQAKQMGEMGKVQEMTVKADSKS